ncbi:MSMEG_0567/Sll0786 family nitrogen starvation N-acetyltransferase [Glaciimonas sp. PCH181]|uniref:MSMEG_0567/Sll0786 family nitrogen starvation N-acetyltransferase n=1 Tax=Glaciimonas sp. PCH181 TaxID=2133943 RepID=UPI000D3AEA50|nr:MSMEG_0567/Sll0786 family nitrogen starvation N-acetyltransferase [Glaciimonas sp. PCH181]PUA19426.1 histone acetyltransferase [Glaciimonas sp. PCH181]
MNTDFALPTTDIPVLKTVRIKLASSHQEREATRCLRRAVFCDEQGIFKGDDQDEIDQHALPIAAILSIPDMQDEVVGTVRIYESEPGVWYGSRLAVATQARRIGSVGSGLIKLAVGTAHARGCKIFLAQVQSQNVPLFKKLHWTSLAEIDVHGRPHHLMQADLAHYPPIDDGDTGFVLTLGAV